MCEDTCAIGVDSFTGEKTIEQAIAVPSETSTIQVIERVSLDAVTLIENIVLVEVTSDDDEAISQVTIEDPIFLITIEDTITQSMTEVKAKVP